MNRSSSILISVATAAVASLTTLSLISLQLQICFTYGFQSSSVLAVGKAPSPSQSQSPFISETAAAKLTTTTRIKKKQSIIARYNNVYGRGADIWPESNDDAVKLSDSFPNGIVPYTAVIEIEQTDMESIHNSSRSEIEHETISKRRYRTQQYIKRILRRAASKDELDNEKSTRIGSTKIPIAIALSLLIRGLVRPMDVAVVACWTTYFIILNMTARSVRESTGAPILPAVPPQGHVPAILSNPMGVRFERSETYRRWLKLGAVLGLIGPIAWLLLHQFVLLPLLWTGGVEPGPTIEAARAVSRPLFLLCCQMTTEAISRRNLVSKNIIMNK